MSPLTWNELGPALRATGYTPPTFPTAGLVFSLHETLMSAGDTGREFPLASVTKLLTTWATLAAVDRGALALDDPINVPEAPAPLTLRELLSHAGGVPREKGGHFKPAQKLRLYSNYGMEIAAQQVEEATGTPFDQWMRDTVLAPLGMADTQLRGSAAWAAHSTTGDLQRFGRELLTPTLISPELSAQALTPHYPHLSGRVPGYRNFSPCPWGLGVEIRGQKVHWLPANLSEATCGHFGVAGSYLWVDPHRGVGAAFLGEQPFGAWHQENWVRLNHAIADVLDKHH